MKAPIYEFITEYAGSDSLRCHMPGHKGRSPVEFNDELYRLDITEISGADSLFEAEGIIAQSERNMTRLYGAAATVYSAGGSTLCIQAMLAIMKQEKRRIIAVRNVHRAFLNAAALLGLDVEWLYPKYNGGILSGEIDLNEAEAAVRRYGSACCLYVTSPDYTGKTADIGSLAQICHKYGARLITDNAHGAHLAFLPENMHPIALGADLCCDSAHKMLPALTGAAMLHTSVPEYAEELKQSMSLFGSTSPSYPIMASLDLCTVYICDRIRSDIAENLRSIEELKNHFDNRLHFAEGEPFHITIEAARSGFSGTGLAQRLRESGVECEYSDSSLVILLMSPMNRTSDYERLVQILEEIIPQLPVYKYKEEPFAPLSLKKAMSIRDAVFSPSEEIDIEKAEGRICASVKVPCPPAVPIAASGEIISRECINIFKRYGISRINVVK